MPSAYEETDIISCLRSKYIIRLCRISYRVSDISLNTKTDYDIIQMKEGAFMSESKLRELSMDFSVDIIELVKHLKSMKESIISDQIGRSGTSIGANIHEAQYAQSKKDFTAKSEIALK